MENVSVACTSEAEFDIVAHDGACAAEGDIGAGGIYADSLELYVWSYAFAGLEVEVARGRELGISWAGQAVDGADVACLAYGAASLAFAVKEEVSLCAEACAC